MTLDGEIKIGVLGFRGMATLVTEQQIQSVEAAPAPVAPIRQKHFPGPVVDPLELRVLAHVLFIRVHKPKASAALGTGEASAALPVDPLVMPQLLPVLQSLAATGARVAPPRGVRQHVRPQPAHVSEQPPAARTQVSVGVRAVVQFV